MSPDDARVVAVAGDVSVHHHVYVRPAPLDLWEFFGATTANEILAKIAPAKAAPGWSVQLAVGVPSPESAAFGYACKHGYSLFRPHSLNGQDSRKVWRAESEIGYGKTKYSFAQHTHSAPSTPPKLDTSLSPNVLLLYDMGQGFWERDRSALLDQIRGGQLRWIVLKMSHQHPAESRLWSELSKAYGDRLICLTSAYKLRKFIDLPQALSWQQAVDDLRRRWFSNKKYEIFAELRKCRHLIVTYSADGGLYLDMFDKQDPIARLVYDPFGVESSFVNTFEGEMPGYELPIAVAIALGLIEDSSPEPSLVPHIKRGLAALRNLVADGHGYAEPDSDEPSGFPATRIATKLMEPNENKFADAEVFWKSIRKMKVTRPWTVIDLAKQKNQLTAELRQLARDVLLRGEAALQGYPQARFGDMITIDRYEIEKLSSLRRQLSEHKRRRSAQPYSVGVFGPPGAGKSFGVSQIASELFGREAWLSFNLAQFGSPGDLIGAFHQVRDRALAGLIPVVFWDEFDSQSLIWLKFFLAPMQDGKFQEGQATHRIGKCVFIFAGGVFRTYEHFSGQESDKKGSETFKSAKGPNFAGPPCQCDVEHLSRAI
jgi:hypothetical protein